MGKVTIKDIAEKAGVAISTVSLTLNGGVKVAAATRGRVLAAVRELNYEADPAGRFLKKDASDILLFCVGWDLSFDTQPTMHKILDGALQEAQSCGMKVMWAKIGEDEKELASFLAYKPCGVIVVGLSHAIVRKLQKYTTNLVVIEAPDDLEGVDFVCVDNHAIGVLAADKLVAAGHRDLLFILGSHPSGQEMLRAVGFRKRLGELGVDCPTATVPLQPADYSMEAGFELGLSALKAPFPSAVFVAGGDPVACGIVHACVQRGLRVPEDISVVGTDDTVGRYCCPRLTTISQPAVDFGRVALRLIEQKRAGAMIQAAQKVILPPAWVEGGTLRRISP